MKYVEKLAPYAKGANLTALFSNNKEIQGVNNYLYYMKGEYMAEYKLTELSGQSLSNDFVGHVFATEGGTSVVPTWLSEEELYTSSYNGQFFIPSSGEINAELSEYEKDLIKRRLIIEKLGVDAVGKLVQVYGEYNSTGDFGYVSYEDTVFRQESNYSGETTSIVSWCELCGFLRGSTHCCGKE